VLIDPRHLGDIPHRERAAITRRFFTYAEELPARLGLPLGWWCGIGLSRSLVFDDPGRSGDVDIIAGPLMYDLSDEDFQARVRAEEVKRPFNPAIPGYAVTMAHANAGQDGCVAWPPAIGYVVGCEAKASYHDGARWKSTHINEGDRIRGQLDYLRAQGVNKAAFMHLGGIAPSALEPGSWEASGRSLEEAGRTFPVVFADTRARGYGYYRALMAAIGGQNEVFAGAHSNLQELLPARELHPLGERPWHPHLRERLRALGRPNFLRTYVFECPECRAWQLSGIVDPTGQHCLQCKALLFPLESPPLLGSPEETPASPV
jgi:hypothetical protein